MWAMQQQAALVKFRIYIMRARPRRLTVVLAVEDLVLHLLELVEDAPGLALLAGEVGLREEALPPSCATGGLRVFLFLEFLLKVCTV